MLNHVTMFDTQLKVPFTWLHQTFLLTKLIKRLNGHPDISKLTSSEHLSDVYQVSMLIRLLLAYTAVISYLQVSPSRVFKDHRGGRVQSRRYLFRSPN